MSLAPVPLNTGNRTVGIGLVIAFHLALGYALVSGLARQVVEVIQKPLDVMLVDDPHPPAPPPPPPPVRAAPRVEAAAPAPRPPAVVVPAPAPPGPIAAEVGTVSAPAPVPAPPPEPAPSPAPHVPVRVAPVIDAARNCQKPEYPPASRRREEAGTVVLRFLIDPDGNVTDSKVETSSGFPALDVAARDALSRCRFKPGSVDGRPEPSWAQLKYTWRLQ